MADPGKAKADGAVRADAAEVWLRGNPRPAVVVLAVVGVATLAAGGGVAVWRPGGWVTAGVVAAGTAALAAAAGFAWAAARPRLACRGDTLEVRLAPLGVQRVPLELVECVFPGSQPVGGDDAVAERRVSTLVVRLAERAVEWRSRPVSRAWGSWDDGSVVFDGRWCEPLSPAVAREVSARLLEARRRLATEPRS